MFRGYNGEDMFRLKKKEMDRLIGQQEAQRLESQILVQKNKEGVINFKSSWNDDRRMYLRNLQLFALQKKETIKYNDSEI